ncbi:guanylate-binding protein 1-like isoform X1 [Branchiostoma floridae]|uniref:Guanylate-binding protein 1-like isoform X1 n=1 Tax=Branchiostoma floridae TaxID=7739 RepID=A0A9J7N4S3_BRAFL|nr:guanylate-binding protein 1-like isoform X1 [Branchiostoma floridae]
MQSRLHDGFTVQKLKFRTRKVPKTSSIPLILPNDLKYNGSKGTVEKVRGARRSTLCVVPEALELLEGIKGPVSALSICGPCRTGKSYVLSRLLGSADAFELGHRWDPQTFGIWMGTKVLKGADFTILLLDTEGIDASGGSADQDASILVLTILLSSLLIYNSLNVPYKGDLEKMQCFIKLAKGVTVKKGQKTQMSELREFFPDFLWLLRDVSLMSTDENGREIDPTQYLKTRVLARGEDFEETPGDMVGRAILTSFPSVECFTLERPSDNKQVMNNIADHTDKLNPEFNKGVETLIGLLLQKSRPKRGYYKGSTVNGIALSLMVKQYVEAVNDPQAIPALDNTWRNTIQLMRSRAIEEAIQEYREEMAAGIATVSQGTDVQIILDEDIEDEMDEALSLMSIHNKAFTKVTSCLLDNIGHLGIGSGDLDEESEGVVREMQERLVRREERTIEYVGDDLVTRRQQGMVVVGGELYGFLQENRSRSRAFCTEMFNTFFEPVQKKIESPPAGYDFRGALDELERTREQYHRWARGPEKWAVLQEMTKNWDSLRANIKKIRGYQEQLMLEQERAHQAELEAQRKNREARRLYNQQQDMQRAHKETLEKMNQLHKWQMAKVKMEGEVWRWGEEQKFEDFRQAQMDEMANLSRELQGRHDREVQQLKSRMQRQQDEMNGKIRELNNRLRQPPPPPPRRRRKGGCVIM